MGGDVAQQNPQPIFPGRLPQSSPSGIHRKVFPQRTPGHFPRTAPQRCSYTTGSIRTPACCFPFLGSFRKGSPQVHSFKQSSEFGKLGGAGLFGLGGGGRLQQPPPSTNVPWPPPAPRLFRHAPCEPRWIPIRSHTRCATSSASDVGGRRLALHSRVHATGNIQCGRSPRAPVAVCTSDGSEGPGCGAAAGDGACAGEATAERAGERGSDEASASGAPKSSGGGACPASPGESHQSGGPSSMSSSSHCGGGAGSPHVSSSVNLGGERGRGVASAAAPPRASEANSGGVGDRNVARETKRRRCPACGM